MPSHKTLTTAALIYGAFTLGFFVAIQGPTLIDLIDMLHVNNDIMSYSIALASLAYSVGGLLSGFLFNYVDRQLLMVAFYLTFGFVNIITPFLSNYILYTVITVFKMMCAGGSDCGSNVLILNLWPGRDELLQALHFSFAVGCALGPLLVEPFLSDGSAQGPGEMLSFSNGTSSTSLSSSVFADAAATPSESKIHIPFAVSGTCSILAGLSLFYLKFSDPERKKALAAAQQQSTNATVDRKLSQISIVTSHQQAAAAVVASAANATTIATANSSPTTTKADHQLINMTPLHQQQQQQHLVAIAAAAAAASAAAAAAAAASSQAQQLQQDQQLQQSTQQPDHQPLNAALISTNPQVTCSQQLVVAPTTPQKVKITSKARENPNGKQPYYVLVAVALAAMCLSSYCGIEITSMTYLTTFAVNIELQLSKSTAALMSSALTVSFAVGRGIGIYMAAKLKPYILFYICASFLVFGNVIMLIFANTSEWLLWISICMFGAGCGPMLPAVLSFFDDRIAKVTNVISGIFILGSMFNHAFNSLIIGHHIVDNALILIITNLVGSVLLLCLFGTLHMLSRVKKSQRVKKYRKRHESLQLQVQTNVPLHQEQRLQIQQQSQQP